MNSKITVLFFIAILLVAPNLPASGDRLTGSSSITKKPLNEKLFDAKIQVLMYLAHMPSLTACAIRHDQVVWEKSYRNPFLRREADVSLNTSYMIASISKTFTATAIFQLYEQGKFGLDDDVSPYAGFEVRNPRFPDQLVTFRMLLSHQSSLARLPVRLFIDFSLLGYPDSWLKELLQPSGHLYSPDVWHDYAPGTRYNYSDAGFMLLGYLVERISGQPFSEYCSEHIFRPLDMNDTHYYLTNYSWDDVALPYLWVAGFFVPLRPYQIGCFAAGGLRTTVPDLSHFLIAHMNHGVYHGTRILKNETVDTMHARQNGSSYFGLGWLNWTDSQNITYNGHSGRIVGGRAEMWYRTSDDTGIIYVANQFEFLRNLAPNSNTDSRTFVNFSLTHIETLLWDQALR